MKIEIQKKSVARRSLSIATLGLLGLMLLVTAFSCSAQGEPTIEELLEKSHEAYRRLSPFEVIFTTVVEFPGSDPGKRTLRYRLGKGNQALIEIGTLMRIVATENKLFIENKTARQGGTDGPVTRMFALDLDPITGGARYDPTC